MGHFNPAILRHNFLKECCGLDFGSPVTASPQNIPVVSELQYRKVRWFMDYDRMVVHNTAIEDLSDFTAPDHAVIYLGKLPYTPLLAAGVNLHADFQVSDSIDFWDCLSDTSRILSAVQCVQGKSVEIISKQRQKNGIFEFWEVNIHFSLESGARIQMSLKRAEMGEIVSGRYNFEIRQLEVDRTKLSSLSSQKLEIAGFFFGVVEELAGGRT